MISFFLPAIFHLFYSPFVPTMCINKEEDEVQIVLEEVEKKGIMM